METLHQARPIDRTVIPASTCEIYVFEALGLLQDVLEVLDRRRAH